ncbi:MAG TPA: hypothetical protein VF177_02165 [Anaerolineae bacterium]
MEKTKVADLTVDEFRDLVKEIVEQTMREMIEDPDEGLPLREDMEEALQRSLTAHRSGSLKTVPVQELADKLGLEW